MINFKVEQFEGPLGLLLRMVESEEMDITRISLAKVADQYIAYIRNTSYINPDETADFLVVAAKLLLIKSKALLPYLFPEEEEEIEDLENQLKMYKEFIEASRKIRKLIGKKKFMFAREFNRKALLANANVFAPPKSLESGTMKMIFEDILARLQPADRIEEETLESKISIEDKILAIEQMLLERIKFGFNRLLEAAESKTEIIVSFLALLELIKQRTVEVSQERLFEEIIVGRRE